MEISPLIRAAQEGDRSKVEQLLWTGMEVNERSGGGSTALMAAAEKRCLDVVRFLVQHGAAIHDKDNDGMTALIFAAGQGHLDVVRWLVEHGAAINDKDNYGSSALIFASRQGHLDVVRWLTDHGAAINEKNSIGISALMIAVENGHLEVLLWLVRHGAEINDRDNDGMTAIMHAALLGNMEVVHWLGEYGAAINEKNSNGSTALICVAQTGHLDIARWLVEHGAEINDTNNEGDTALTCAASNGHFVVVRYLIENGAVINEKGKDGNTALFWAAAKNNSDTVRWLVEHDADFEITNSQGQTALTVATDKNHEDIVKYLCSTRVAFWKAVEIGHLDEVTRLMDQYLHSRDEHGRTAVLLAAEKSQFEVLKSLIYYGADLTGGDDVGRSVLHLAAQSGDVQIVRFLLQQQCVTTFEDDRGHLAIDAAARCGHEAVVRELLLHTDASSEMLQHVDVNGQTILHHACTSGNMVLVEFLLSQDVSIDVADHRGWTSLVWAVSIGNAPMVVLLLEHGSDVETRTCDDRTPLLIASELGCVETIKVLLEYGARVDVVAQDGSTPLNAAPTSDLKLVLALYQKSQQFHECCFAFLSNAKEPPLIDEVVQLVPLITSVYNLRLLLAVAFVAVDLVDEMRQVAMLSPVLRHAFDHVLSNKLVVDDDACVFFKLVLEHCNNHALISRPEFLRWEGSAVKVNMESAAWVIDLKKQVYQNSYRLQAHDQSIGLIAEGMVEMCAEIVRNREAITYVAEQTEKLQQQAMMAKQVLRALSNELGTTRREVSLLSHRMETTEANLIAVACSLQDFRDAFKKRLDHDRRTRRMKAGCRFLASIASFVLGPWINDICNALIDSTDPVEIFNTLYSGSDIAKFVAEKTSNLLNSSVQQQLERFAIPVDTFEEVLRRELVLRSPEILTECEKRGLMVSCEVADSSVVTSLQSQLAHTAPELVRIIEEIHKLKPPSRSTDDITSGISELSAYPPPTVVDTYPVMDHRMLANADLAVPPLSSRHCVGRNSMIPCTPPSSGHLKHVEEPKIEIVIDGNRVEFIDSLEAFQYHHAICESGGSLEAFLELIDVISTSDDELNGVMKLRLVNRIEAMVALSAAEYAYSLGYRNVGDLLVSEAPDQVVSTIPPASRVELLTDLNEYPYHLAVRESQGNVEEYTTLLDFVKPVRLQWTEERWNVWYETVSGSSQYAMDSRVDARLVREEIHEVEWSAVEFACELGYVDIVKHLLSKKEVHTSEKPVALLIRTLQRAKAKTATPAA